MGTRRPKGGTKFGIRPCTKDKIKKRREKNKERKNEHQNGDYRANKAKDSKKVKRVKDANMCIIVHNTTKGKVADYY